MKTTHHAWVCTELREDFGGLRLCEQARLPCPPGQLRLRLHAAALNHPDLLMAQGKYRHRPPLPFIPGLECAGKVIECGDGVGWPVHGMPCAGRRGSAPSARKCWPRRKRRARCPPASTWPRAQLAAWPR